MEIIFEHPSWLILVCALSAALLAVFLYRRDRLNRHIGAGLRVFLGFMRFVVYFLVAIFLLHPLVKSTEQETEEPVIVIAQDNSESVMLAVDSSYMRTQWKTELERLKQELEANYQVRTFTFGDRLNEGMDSLLFQEKTTDLSALFDGLYNRFSNRNLGGIIIASDGIYNVGKDPRYTGKKLNAPIFTVALGDTTQKRDIRVADVANNKLAYLGNTFPIEIAVEATKATNQRSRLDIVHNGKIVFTEELTFNGSYALETRRALIEADGAGLQRYTIRISPLENEERVANNVRDVFIEVLETRQKVLMLTAAPHPDINAMREAIASNLNYEVEVALAREFDKNLEPYSLIIFHQLPGGQPNENRWVDTALEQGKSSLFVLGSQTNYNRFNDLNLGYVLRGYRGTANDIYASYAEGFPYFKLNEQQQRLFRELPPLSVPAGDFETAAGAVHLLSQRVGMIETDMPLWSFNQVQGEKIGLIAGEGIWRWRMVSYLQQESHRPFDELMSSMVQYLASREDRRQFRIDAPRDVLENERIIFSAEVYNDSYESITDPEVELSLTSEEGAEYTFTFGRAGNFYRLDAGMLPVGDYEWTASTRISGRSQKLQGQLTVAPVQLESANTVADHGLLFALADENGGQMTYAGQLNELPAMIEASGEAVALTYERSSLIDLINWQWLLFLLLTLLSAEWLIRKRSGSY